MPEKGTLTHALVHKTGAGQSWDRKRMWVWFWDGRVFQWGQAGGWGREADKIYEMRIR